MATKRKSSTRTKRAASASKPATPSNEGRQPKELAFDYIKANFFRVVHADGAIGGLTLNGFLHMGLYSERRALPKRTVFEITPDGKLGPELIDRRQVRDAIVREVECDVIMDEHAMRSLHKWLGEKIDELHKLKQVALPARAAGKPN